MLHCILLRQADCIHSCRMCQNESKILPSQPISRATGLSRNRSGQTVPKLYCRTIFFTNQPAILYSNKQPSNRTWKHQELESHTFWACKQRKGRYKNQRELRSSLSRRRITVSLQYSPYKVEELNADSILANQTLNSPFRGEN